MSNLQPASVESAIADLTEAWQPRDLGIVNETAVRLVRLDGAFPWHHHAEDEFVLCWRGSFRIEMRDAAPVTLAAGGLFVVPHGVEHRPAADDVAFALIRASGDEAVRRAVTAASTPAFRRIRSRFWR